VLLEISMFFLKSNIDPIFVFTSNDPCVMNHEAVPLFLQIKMLCHAVLLDVGFVVGFNRSKRTCCINVRLESYH
jgi:hypothetical protein